MLRVFRLLLIASTMTLLTYVVLWVVTGVWESPMQAATLDTLKGETDLYSRPVREFAYRLPAFCGAARGKRNLIFIGGSVARAYRPAIIGKGLPDWNVSDVSLDLANITEMKQGFALIRDCLGHGGLHDATFVLAVNFLQFSQNERIWKSPYTYLELDMLRHGLYDGEAGGIRPTLPWQWMPYAVSAMRPMLAAYGLSYRAGLVLDDTILRWAGARGRPDPGHSLELSHLTANFSSKDRDAFNEQIAELDSVVAAMRAEDAGVIILDMPVEDWLRDGVPQFSAYRGWIADYARRNGIPYIDHTFAGNGGEFVDGFHATPDGERHWSALAVDALRPLLSPQ